MLSPLAVLAWALLAGAPNPRSAELVGRAYAAMAYKDYAQAAPLWRELAALEPQDARARVELGRCLLRLDQPHEALRALEEALALDPAVKEGAALLSEARRFASVTPEGPPPRVSPSTKGEHVGPSGLSLAERARGVAKRSGTGRTYELVERNAGRPEPAVRHDLAAEEARAPRALLDSMRRRAEGILRPRMSTAAPVLQELQQASQEYMDACHQKAAANHVRFYGAPASYGSEAQWDYYWTGLMSQGYEDSPECQLLAARVDELASSLVSAMGGADHELGMPPAVYPSVREEVFQRLAAELW